MSSWSKGYNGSSMPTAGQFTQTAATGLGRQTYTDWSAYNDAVNQYNAEQQEKRYQQGLSLYQQAAKLFKNNGVYDKSYRNAKNKYMASASSDLVSRGLGNLVNTAGMSLAYDQQVRPEFEMLRLNQLSQALQNMAQYTGSYQPTQAQPMSWSRTINWPQKNPSSGYAPNDGRAFAGQSLEDSPFRGVSFL